MTTEKVTYAQLQLAILHLRDAQRLNGWTWIYPPLSWNKWQRKRLLTLIFSRHFFTYATLNVWTDGHVSDNYIWVEREWNTFSIVHSTSKQKYIADKYIRGGRKWNVYSILSFISKRKCLCLTITFESNEIRKRSPSFHSISKRKHKCFRRM